MKRYFGGVLILVLVCAIASCRGGARGPLPPVSGTRHAFAAASASATQWTTGSQFAPASITVSWPTAPAVGDVLVVAFWNNGQSSGAANTYTPPSGWNAADQNTAQTYATYAVFTHTVAAGETNAYVFTPLAAQREHVWIAADVANAAGVDRSGNAYVNGTAYTTPTVTPSQSGDLALTFDLPITGSSVTWTNPAGWTVGAGPTSIWHGESLIESPASTSPVSASATLSAAAPGFAGIILLAPSGVQTTPSSSPSSSASSTPAPTAPPSATPTPISGGNASAKQWTSGAQYAPASIAVSWPTAPSAGDVLLIAFWNNGQSTGAANTYTAPAGWSLADQNSGTYATYQVFSHTVGTGETNGYVFTPAAAQREQSWIGVDISGGTGVDKSGNRIISSSTAYSPPSLAPGAANDLAVVFNLPMTLSTLTWTNPAGWSVGTGPTSPWRAEGISEQLSSAAAVTESSTLSGAASGFSGLVLISASGTQTTPTPIPTGSTPTPTPTSTPAGVDWSTFGFDLQRTGYNPSEKIIGTGSFGTMHSFWTSLPSVGGFMQGQPVVAMNVNVGGTNRNVLYAGGGGGMFSAIDADTGSVIWSKQLGTVTYTCPDTGATALWGIEGAPVLDRPRNRVYVPDGANVVHALDLATGAESSGWPVTVAPVTAHDFIHTALNYNASNGLLYSTTGSSCDISPWYGRIAAINASTGAIVNTFYTEQGNSGGGVWGVGGVAIDPSTNNVFVAVGNADSSTENSFYGEHIVELSADLNTVIASNFPTNMPFMYDSDFGATPLLFQPVGCPPLLAAVNKSGAFVLYNRTNIAAGPTQEITMSDTGDVLRGVPSYDPVTNYVYVGLPDTFGIYTPGIAAFSMTASCTLNATPVWSGAFGSTSQDIRSPITLANGVAYVGGYNENTVYAFDAASGTKLWSAALNGAGQIAPVVVNGRIYAGDLGGTIHAWKP